MSRMYTAEVIADSVSPAGSRLTTVKVIYPHAVHKDMLRHRCMNRNVESFRAQPPEKIIENLRNGHAFKPEVFGYRTKGMGQRNEPIDQDDQIDQMKLGDLWDVHVENACDIAELFIESNVAKQQVNFLLQDFCPLTEIITATDWSNFFALRTELNADGSPVARPEVYLTALAIQEALEGSVPQHLDYHQLHLPFVSEDELAVLCDERAHTDNVGFVEDFWIGVSAGRCARISFGDYDWQSEHPIASSVRSQRLLGKGHMSPFEQQARPFSQDRLSLIADLQAKIRDDDYIKNQEITEMCRQLEYSGNLRGWIPTRKEFPFEWDYSLIDGEASASEAA